MKDTFDTGCDNGNPDDADNGNPYDDGYDCGPTEDEDYE